jgi:hypothetical protein
LTAGESTACGPKRRGPTCDAHRIRTWAGLTAWNERFEHLHDGREDTRRAQRHLEREGLLRTSPLNSDDRAVVLTERGRDLLEANRHDVTTAATSHGRRSTRGLRKPRELTHDSKVYRAYLRAEERLREQSGRVNRVVLFRPWI